MPLYTEDDIKQALDDIENGKSTRQAAIDWGVPPSTLLDRKNETENHSKAAESQQKLSRAQEDHLAAWVLTQEALGVPLTHAQIKEFAQRLLVLKGDDKPLGKRWIQAFLKRNPIIKTKRFKSIDSQRVNGATGLIIKLWFQWLSLPQILVIKPKNRYNMDEAGIMEGFGVNGLVVRSSGKRSIQKIHPGSRAWTSILKCISATEIVLKPLIIFKGKTVQQQWFPQDLTLFQGWQFTATKNGWTTDATAIEWLQKVFLPLTDT